MAARWELRAGLGSCVCVEKAVLTLNPEHTHSTSLVLHEGLHYSSKEIGLGLLLAGVGIFHGPVGSGLL
jgi:hypothetical protein